MALTPVLLIIGILICVFYDTRCMVRKDASLYQETMKWPPAAWVFWSTVLFIIIAPVYLMRRFEFRKRLGLKEEISRTEPFLQDHKRFYILTDAAGILLTWAFSFLMVSVVVKFISTWTPILENDLDNMLFATTLFSVVIIALIYQVTSQKPYEGFLNAVALRKGKNTFLSLVVIPFVIGLCLALLSYQAMVSRAVIPATPLAEALDGARSPMTILNFLFLGLVFAPLIEELVFRGYFFMVLSSLKGKWFAITSITVIFGLLHAGQYWGDWLAIGAVCCLRFILTLYRSISRSVIPGIVIHYTYNIFITVIAIVMMALLHSSYFQYMIRFNELNSSQKEQLLKESLSQDPVMPEVYNDLAWLYASEDRNLDEALTLIEKALKVDPKNPAYLDTKAEVLFHRGQVMDAIAIERELLKKDPSNSLIQEQLKKFEGSSLSFGDSKTGE